MVSLFIGPSLIESYKPKILNQTKKEGKKLSYAQPNLDRSILDVRNWRFCFQYIESTGFKELQEILTSRCRMETTLTNMLEILNLNMFPGKKKLNLFSAQFRQKSHDLNTYIQSQDELWERCGMVQLTYYIHWR